MRKTIRAFDPMPKFYGLAYYDPCRCVGIFYPIPLNIIVRLWSSFWCLLKRGLIPHWFEESVGQAVGKERHELTNFYERKLDIERAKLLEVENLFMRVQNILGGKE